jgi:hypothetical protein
MSELYRGKFERLPDEDRDLRPIGDLMHAWRLIGTQKRYYCQAVDTFEPCRELDCGVCCGTAQCTECEGSGEWQSTMGGYGESYTEPCGYCEGDKQCTYCAGKGWDYAPTRRSAQQEPVC